MFSQLFEVLPNFHKCFYNSIENMFSVFLSSYGNTCESLGELEKATENMFSISFRKHCEEKTLQKPFYFDHQNIILFACAIITSIGCVCSVFLLSYRSAAFSNALGKFLFSYFPIYTLLNSNSIGNSG